MGNMFFSLRDFIGFRLKRDIYNKLGAIVLPVNTVLMEEHIYKLLNHGVMLTEDDIFLSEDQMRRRQENTKPPSKSEKVIRESAQQMKSIFERVRKNNKVSILEVKETIIPSVVEATENKNLFQLFQELKAKDDYSYRHNISVGILSTLIGQWMKLDNADLSLLTLSATLHDIGKMKIPEEILHKPEPWTREEHEMVKKHTIYGYEIIKNTVGASHRTALVALQHHEREDGSGYPLAVSRDKIDPFSKIVAVADVFHERMAGRIERERKPFYKVVKEMRNEAFGKLDHEIVTLFLNNIMSALVGSEVTLTDGRKGIVVMINHFNLVDPLIRVGDEFIDLNQHPSLHIQEVGV